jgi:hypothetical protein
MTQDERIQTRANEIAQEATATLTAIRELASEDVTDPYIDAPTLTRAVQSGILDAPQLKNNPFASGKIVTRVDSRGACIAIDSTSGDRFSESDRIASLKTL